jgi:hypothetical protein
MYTWAYPSRSDPCASHLSTRWLQLTQNARDDARASEGMQFSVALAGSWLVVITAAALTHIFAVMSGFFFFFAAMVHVCVFVCAEHALFCF